MRQKYRKAGVVYNVAIHIHGNVGQVFTADINGGVTVDSSSIEQSIKSNAGTVAGRDMTNRSLLKAVARLLESAG